MLSNFEVLCTGFVLCQCASIFSAPEPVHAPRLRRGCIRQMYEPNGLRIAKKERTGLMYAIVFNALWAAAGRRLTGRGLRVRGRVGLIFGVWRCKTEKAWPRIRIVFFERCGLLSLLCLPGGTQLYRRVPLLCLPGGIRRRWRVFLLGLPGGTQPCGRFALRELLPHLACYSIPERVYAGLPP